MITQLNSGSGNVFAFPVGGRKEYDMRQRMAKLYAANTVRPTPMIESGSGWYHEEAVRSASPVTPVR